MCWENGSRNATFLNRFYLKKQHKKNKRTGYKMGLIEELRKKFQKENADEYILKIDIKLNGNAEKRLKELKKKEVKKNVKRRL